MNRLIDCLRCGNCCPKDCEYFSISDGVATCITYNGNTYITDEGREMIFCKKPPEYWFTNGIACRSIMESNGMSWPPNGCNVETQENGQVLLKFP
jgi:hypothetical protein